MPGDARVVPLAGESMQIATAAGSVGVSAAQSLDDESPAPERENLVDVRDTPSDDASGSPMPGDARVVPLVDESMQLATAAGSVGVSAAQSLDDESPALERDKSGEFIRSDPDLRPVRDWRDPYEGKELRQQAFEAAEQTQAHASDPLGLRSPILNPWGVWENEWKVSEEKVSGN